MAFLREEAAVAAVWFGADPGSAGIAYRPTFSPIQPNVCM